jgi:hypothetical protein
MIPLFQLVFSWFFKFPMFVMYIVYDLLLYNFYGLFKKFYGWGIHLYTGKFGTGKTMAMVIKAYLLCRKYKQLSVLTNIKLENFPKHTRILELKHVEDILEAPEDCLVLIDEIGTLFNSRDFMTTAKGERAVPKPMFQHLCQCRKRRMMILATVQRFNLLDKQIRDVSATVRSCRVSFAHPFSRAVTVRTFDIDEYEKYNELRTYNPRIDNITLYIQKNRYRQLYSTKEMVDGLLKSRYYDDKDILENQGVSGSFFGDKTTNRQAKKRKKF